MVATAPTRKRRNADSGGGGPTVMKKAIERAHFIIAGNGAVLERTKDSKALGTTFRCVPACAKTLVGLEPGDCRMPVGDIMADLGADTLFCGGRTRRNKATPAGGLEFQTYCDRRGHRVEAHKSLPGGGRPTEKQLTKELRRHL